MRGFIHVFLLFICLFPVRLAAQDRVTLSGEVRGEDGAPLPMVTVAIENTTAGTYTDDRGRYSLSLKPGKHTLLLSEISDKSSYPNPSIILKIQFFIL